MTQNKMIRIMKINIDTKMAIYVKNMVRICADTVQIIQSELFYLEKGCLGGNIM